MEYARGTIVAGLLLWGAVTAPAVAQQVPGTAFNPRIEKPEYPAARGPKVLIDAAHLNFHTAEGGYAPRSPSCCASTATAWNPATNPSARLCWPAPMFSSSRTPMHKQSEQDFAPLPNLSAFTEAEIAEVEKWVRAGGSLLLIADHMPLAGHAEALAAASARSCVMGPAGSRSSVKRRCSARSSPGPTKCRWG